VERDEEVEFPKIKEGKELIIRQQNADVLKGTYPLISAEPIIINSELTD
jgi:hypothetical protein